MSTRIAEMKPAELSVAQLRSAILERYTEAKEIEDRYPNGLTMAANAEDYGQVKILLTELDTLEDVLAPKEEAEARISRISANVKRYTTPARASTSEPQIPVFRSPGDFFVEDKQYAAVKAAGLLQSNRNQINLSVPLPEMNLLNLMGSKALIYSGTGVGGALVQNDVRPGIVDILQRSLNVLDLIPRSTTESDTVEYVLESAFTNNAAFTAEATATTGTSGTKPESVLTFSPATTPVKTLAHWIPVTNRMLSDAAQIRGIINGRLLLGLDLALETQVISGDGTGENLTGILNTALINIESAGSSNNAADALYKGRTQCMVTGLARPSAYVLHPNDWQAIRLLRENVASGTLGGYLMGPPSINGPTTLWGLPVVESLAITENTGLIGDWAMGCTLFDREQSQLRVGTINDQLVRNMQTILAELRAAFVVWRPTAFCKVTGI